MKEDAKYKDQLVTVSSLRQRLAMLVARRVDFFVDDELAGLYLIQKNNQQGIELHPYIVNNDSVYFMLSETTLLAEDRAAINSAILNNQQAITEIIARYVKH